MKQLLLICAVVALVGGCASTNPIVETEIREAAKKPTGKLTKADYEKVTRLVILRKQLTGVKGLEKLTQLKTLYLSSCGLTDTDVKGLEKLTKLESLVLNNNQLTSVKGLEKLTELERLHLGENRLTDLKGLEKLTQLTMLWIRNNPDLTKAQIDQLRKALPKCVIDSDHD